MRRSLWWEVWRKKTKLHAKNSQKTMSRLMKLQQECMCPKVVKVGELAEKLLQWEEK